MNPHGSLRSPSPDLQENEISAGWDGSQFSDEGYCFEDNKLSSGAAAELQRQLSSSTQTTGVQTILKSDRAKCSTEIWDDFTSRILPWLSPGSQEGVAGCCQRCKPFNSTTILIIEDVPARLNCAELLWIQNEQYCTEAQYGVEHL